MNRVILGLLALTMLGACGVKGDLARPDPLWNSDDAIRRDSHVSAATVAHWAHRQEFRSDCRAVG